MIKFTWKLYFIEFH